MMGSGLCAVAALGYPTLALWRVRRLGEAFQDRRPPTSIESLVSAILGA
ncbi:MAG: hypothetical protein U0166_05240 [Acidobacteriota bacterium]